MDAAVMQLLQVLISQHSNMQASNYNGKHM